MGNTSPRASPPPLGRAIGTKDLTKQKNAKELDTAKTREDIVDKDLGKEIGSGDQVLGGTADLLKFMGDGTLDSEDAETTVDVIGILTPIHMAVQGTASFDGYLVVWGTLPRPNGRFEETTDTATSIIGITITIFLPPRVFSVHGHPQALVNSCSSAFGTQEEQEENAAMMMSLTIPMVMNMFGWGEVIPEWRSVWTDQPPLDPLDTKRPNERQESRREA